MPQTFQPTWDEEKTRRLLDHYKSRGANIHPSTKDVLEQHASYHNLPFYLGDFDLLNTVKQAGTGFWEGMTTLRTPPWGETEHPQTLWLNL